MAGDHALRIDGGGQDRDRLVVDERQQREIGEAVRVVLHVRTLELEDPVLRAAQHACPRVAELAAVAFDPDVHAVTGSRRSR